MIEVKVRGLNDQRRLLQALGKQVMSTAMIAAYLGITQGCAQKRIARLRAKKLVRVVERSKQPSGLRGADICFYGPGDGLDDAPALLPTPHAERNRVYHQRKKARRERERHALWGGLGDLAR